MGLISCEDAKPGCLDKEMFKKVIQIAKDRGFYIPDRERPKETKATDNAKRSALEEALLFVADRCDGATSSDGQGFNKNDSTFGKTMADKVRSGQRLTVQEYKDVYKMLKTYNKNQLVPAGMDIRLIPKEPPVEGEAIPEKEPIPIEAREAALDILKHKAPLRPISDTSKERFMAARNPQGPQFWPATPLIFLQTTGYMRMLWDLHRAANLQLVTAVLETFPEENVIVTSEASPKSLYYLAQENPERLQDTIVYIDDARPEHIPLLKTFRNEGNVTPRNLTVSDGEVQELIVKYRPVVLASSVTPLRDMEQQVGSRTFLASIPDATPEEEKKVRAAIRRQVRAGAILSPKNDGQLKILRAMAGILRDEGLREVLVPFDAVEPVGADRRGTGQFQRLIKISAFINQFQRPILELTDGRKFVLAIYEDLKTAAKIWFDFAEGQEFKISPKALDVLDGLPNTWPGKSLHQLLQEKWAKDRERLSDI